MIAMRQQTLCWPVALQTTRQCAFRYAAEARPLDEHLSFLIDCNQTIATFIAPLFLTRGPVAVLRGVAKFVVSAFDGMMGRWTRTHVRVKVREDQPARTNSNAPSAIVDIFNGGRIQASTQHRVPHPIFRAACSSMRLSLAIRDGSQTTARTGMAITEVARFYDSLNTATASAQHSPLVVRAARRFSDNGQVSELISDDDNMRSQGCRSLHGDGVGEGWSNVQPFVQPDFITVAA